MRVAQNLLERPDPALPVHEHAGLLGHRGDREDDVRGASHGAGAQLEADHEAGGGEARPGAAAGSGRSTRSTPPTTSASMSPVAAGCEDAVGVAAGAQRHLGRDPSGREVHARGGVVERTAARQQVGQAAGLQCAAVPGTAGHPGEPGAGCAARLSAADSAPGTSRAAPHEDHAAAVERRSRRRWRAPPGRPARHRARCGPACRASCCRPRDVNGAIETTLVPLRAALRSRRNTIGDSSSGSRPASSTTLARSRSA